ncbi:hypothetical protein CWI39_0710p0010 [Hamiltosporidium magnivora]|uniref:Uncharacterized protein n=1 Tax=Hamiltosporidium magnivora TaxID=148818 RepID=A0A4Q9LCQ5_9MICR|nr:hypothetical protein CWI39_0710p0010 [Hamiltosporidium magnivora]
MITESVNSTQACVRKKPYKQRRNRYSDSERVYGSLYRNVMPFNESFSSFRTRLRSQNGFNRVENTTNALRINDGESYRPVKNNSRKFFVTKPKSFVSKFSLSNKITLGQSLQTKNATLSSSLPEPISCQNIKCDKAEQNFSVPIGNRFSRIPLIRKNGAQENRSSDSNASESTIPCDICPKLKKGIPLYANASYSQSSSNHTKKTPIYYSLPLIKSLPHHGLELRHSKISPHANLKSCNYFSLSHNDLQILQYPILNPSSSSRYFNQPYFIFTQSYPNIPPNFAGPPPPMFSKPDQDIPPSFTGPPPPMFLQFIQDNPSSFTQPPPPMFPKPDHDIPLSFTEPPPMFVKMDHNIRANYSSPNTFCSQSSHGILLNSHAQPRMFPKSFHNNTRNFTQPPPIYSRLDQNIPSNFTEPPPLCSRLENDMSLNFTEPPPIVPHFSQNNPKYFTEPPPLISQSCHNIAPDFTEPPPINSRPDNNIPLNFTEPPIGSQLCENIPLNFTKPPPIYSRLDKNFPLDFTQPPPICSGLDHNIPLVLINPPPLFSQSSNNVPLCFTEPPPIYFRLENYIPPNFRELPPSNFQLHPNPSGILFDHLPSVNQIDIH